jgi:hypothetical protein
MNSQQQNIVSLANKIIMQDIDKNTFELAFGSAFDFDSEDDYDVLINCLTDIANGEEANIKSEFLDYIVGLALDGAAYCLYDKPIEQFYDNFTTYQEMVDGVLVEVVT